MRLHMLSMILVQGKTNVIILLLSCLFLLWFTSTSYAYTTKLPLLVATSTKLILPSRSFQLQQQQQQKHCQQSTQQQRQEVHQQIQSLYTSKVFNQRRHETKFYLNNANNDHDLDLSTKTECTTCSSVISGVQQVVQLQVVKTLASIALISTLMMVGSCITTPILVSAAPTASATSTSTSTTTMTTSINYSEDYTSEPVQKVLQELKENSGTSIDGTVHVLEEIVSIITEGKGIGGEINYQGIQLERGYVSDEDTTIYNPGLTLLTENEKNKLIRGIIESRTVGIKTNTWNIDTQAGYEFVREKLDPLHTYELQNYLKIVPIYVAILYSIVIAIQQYARTLFESAYIIAVIAFFVPAFFLISIGPQ